MPTSTIEQAYDACQTITRQQARNFSYGIRLLPRDRRAAVSAVYALARRIDDVGDGNLPAAGKRVRLAAIRSDVQRLGAGHEPDDPVLVALADAARRFPIPLSAFDELIDGVGMDVEMDAAMDTTTDEDILQYLTFDELVVYCRSVAGSIGRLCLGIFGGGADPRAPAHADALGIALQQTNVLRDIREDLVHGRVYLPQADLERFGVELRIGAGGALADDDGRLQALIRSACTRAQGWYDEGLRLVPLLDRRSAACCLAMAGIYARLTQRIAADPAGVLNRRLSLSGREKATVAAGALLRRAA
jgi:phytoene synthase